MARKHEGYVLVPVEPTMDMIYAGDAADTTGAFVEDVYRAMIQASQIEN